MDPSRRIRKKTAYHHGDLRRSLTNAALRLVEEQGSAAVTLREAARMAGVSHQAPYRHFQSRTDLLGAVAEDGFRALHAELVEKTREAADAGTALRTIGLTYVLFAVAHPAHFRVMFGAEAAESRKTNASLAAASDAVFGMVTSTMARVKVDAGGEELGTLSLTAWSVVHGLAWLLVEGQLDSRYSTASQRELTELITAVLRRGVGGALALPQIK